jgi:cytoskeletal protein CcmA (bactofilin family)
LLNIFILLRGSSVCFIPDGMIIQGSMDLKVPGYIYGTINGNVTSTAKVYIGSSGTINGNVNAKELVINGHVEGNVFAIEKAEIKKNAVVKGRVNAAPIILEKEGIILGKVNESEEDIKKSMEELNRIALSNAKDLQTEVIPITWF